MLVLTFFRSLTIALLLLTSSLAAQAPALEDSGPPRLPDSGQTVRYSQTFGEDADYTGSEPKYVDNKDGTITDVVTGLMWQKTDGGEMTWERAKQYASNCRLGEQSDWRLPTSLELFSIMNHGKHGPAMDTAYFTKTEARYWWTVTPRVDDKSKIWVVNTGGGIGAHAKTETTSAGGERPIHVRCVRGDSKFGLGPMLKDNGDGTVTDQRTGLIWQKVQASQAMSWEEALKHCATTEIAGHKDWRLPNIKELRSLSDDGKVRPSIDKSLFPGAKSASYWSSTSQANRPERAWYVEFTTGLVTYSDKTEKLEVIAVRDENSKAGTRDKPVPDPKLIESPSKSGKGQSTEGKTGNKRNGKKDKAD